MYVDTRLLEWCTDRQREIVESLNETGSGVKTASDLGISRSTIRSAIRRIKSKAALHGYSPDHNLTQVVPDPFIVTGHSTYYDRDNKPRGQWVKTKLDDQRREEVLRATIEALSESISPLPPVRVDESAEYQSNLLNLYPLTDVHMGMHAWHEEGGANWDLKIAEETVSKCFAAMIDHSPNSETAFIAQIGDWFHSDGLLPVTPAHGHVLDQDGRFAKIVKAGIRLARRCIDASLLKHHKVVVLMGEGNHDESASIWLQNLFALLYENEPRVEVIETPLPYYYWQHGNTVLFFHHGHKCKLRDLPLAFASLFPEIWGNSKKRYGHTGHKHTKEIIEFPGITIYQHPTIAAKDAYAARAPWLSERQAASLTYHKEFGEVANVIVTPEMVGISPK